MDRTYRFDSVLNDRPFSMEVAVTAAASAAEAEDLAVRARHWVAAHVMDLRRQCARDLLDDYEAEWAAGDDRRDGRAPLSMGDFGSRLVLRALAVAADGSLRVTYLDDGMFAGHVVVVETDPTRERLTAFLEG